MPYFKEIQKLVHLRTIAWDKLPSTIVKKGKPGPGNIGLVELDSKAQAALSSAQSGVLTALGRLFYSSVGGGRTSLDLAFCIEGRSAYGCVSFTFLAHVGAEWKLTSLSCSDWTGVEGLYAPTGKYNRTSTPNATLGVRPSTSPSLLSLLS